MTWISLVCLLVLSSAALIRAAPFDGYGSTRVLESGYGATKVFEPAYGATKVLEPAYGATKVIEPSYGATKVIEPSYGATRVIEPSYGATKVIEPSYGATKLIEPSYGATKVIEPSYGATKVIEPSYGATKVIESGYGQVLPPLTRSFSNYGGYGSTNRFLDRAIIEELPPTQADILCRGQLPQTVIPIEGNRKFVVCLDDGKGTEQSCPAGLVYHEGTRRCERRLGPLEDFCVSQPCLNGGLCVSTDSTFQCQCPRGFDGTVCELNSMFCENNRPCGSDPSVRCQSFRPGAALEWICVSDFDNTYGPDGSHAHRSPCDSLNGPHALAFTNKGFIMCNGEHSHYESCPGGTIWDNFSKACVWPDMEEMPIVGQTRLIGQSGYGFSAPAPITKVFSSYDKVMLPPPKVFSSYGAAPSVRRFSSYGGEVTLPAPMPETRVISSYGAVPEVRRVSSYGGEVTLPAPMPETKLVSSYGGEITVPETRTFSSYGSSRMILPPPIVKTAPAY